MDRISHPSRLSRIDTLWSVVQQAHDGESTAVVGAQQQLLDLYGSAIKRYLVASVRDQDLADELFQEFAVKFIRGDFRSADPARGKFRSFVKTSLSRMIAQHYRKLSRRKELALDQAPEQVAGSPPPDDDPAFLASWRDELLSRTWQSLAAHESQTGVRYNSILRLRVAQPGLTSEELAEQLTEIVGKPVTPSAARVYVHRAREKFASLLMEVVAHSLDSRDRSQVEAELIELGLIEYCQEGLEQLNDDRP